MRFLVWVFDNLTIALSGLAVYLAANKDPYTLFVLCLALYTSSVANYLGRK